MSLRLADWWQRGAGYLGRRCFARPMILLYHRIADDVRNPWYSSVTPEHFAEHLEVLHRHARVVPLRELVEAMRAGAPPRRTVAITFDDGYADNLHTAKPLLAAYGMPATVFVATGAMDAGREFWWDELEQLILEPAELPRRLQLATAEGAFTWELARPRKLANGAFDDHERIALHRALWSFLQSLPAARRRALLDELAGWAGVLPVVRPSHRPLADDELRALAADGLIDVGAHSVAHPVLTDLPGAAQRAEIVGSKARCEAVLGRSIASFAYPHGSYSAATVAIVREAGFAYACSAIPNVIWRRAHRFALPRLAVHDCSGGEFARRFFPHPWLDRAAAG